MKTQIRQDLSTVARAYKNGGLIGGLVCPIVPVNKREFIYTVFGKENLLGVDTKKSPKGQTPRLGLEFGSAEGVCEDHAFAVELDKRQREDDEVGATIRAPRVAMDVIMLRHEVLVKDLIFGAANYAVGLKSTLAGASQWTHADSDPVAAVNTAKAAVRNKVGLEPNTLVIGGAVLDALRVHAKIRSYLPDNQLGVVDETILARIFGVERVLVGKAIVSDSEGTVSTVWGDFAAVIHVKATAEGTADMQDPCFAKTFAKRGYPMTDGWYVDDTDVQYYRTAHCYKVAQTHQEAGYLFSDVCA
ncbi:MAG: hypothetical protein IV100_12565 [Myxococcales bacterium]|uniref:hypothetical protein n=1 Tax=Sediminibacterium sp. TaxID=1917865 RepID=UPI001DE21DD0|nr:hypothetical protein [Sediminibacterium sp.]MBT9485833.1 hypothetical protein [Sediminibacterium sp.]MBT9556859.1 hypothetical protein [Myxococcales bacterium]